MKFPASSRGAATVSRKRKGFRRRLAGRRGGATKHDPRVLDQKKRKKGKGYYLLL